MPGFRIATHPGVLQNALVHSKSDLVVFRLFDFLHRRTPWHRRLWTIGTVLSLQEVVEYSRIRRESRTPADGLVYVCKAAKREVAHDPAAAAYIGEITAVLDRGDQMSADDENRLMHLSARVDERYLEVWAGAIELPDSPPVERTARSIASHLLDKGFSSDHLYRWLDAARHRPEVSHSDLIREGHEMCETTRSRRYDVLVPCFVPGIPTKLPPAVAWLSAELAAARIQEIVGDAKKPRHAGAFVVSVNERDPWAAVDAAGHLMARVAARVQVGRPGPDTVRTSGVAFVIGNNRTFRLDPPRRQLDIHSLYRQEKLFAVDPDDFPQLDDALELAAYLETGSPGAAVTGGWAAIEGLLMYPGERGHVIAADRLAAIVACSVGRAELTPLAHTHADMATDELATQLKALPAEASNYQRVLLAENFVRDGGVLVSASASDKAAFDRVAGIVSEPHAVLERVRTYVQDSLRRLYNQRNLVMHGGSFRSCALGATLRTTPPLVGAGLDRVVHAQLRRYETHTALELSARAHAELDLLKGAGAGRVVDLLGR